jgi:sugar/nucleoside kinase (ribokinase family)
MSDILVVGSLAYDSVKTPAGQVDRALGGSANYFAVVASMFAPVKVVGVVGEDYAASDLAVLTSRGVDVSGLQKKSGKTFHWAGAYDGAMNEAQTLATELNVFADFNPELPATHRQARYVFLANIDPELQLKVLDQVERPRLVGMDTMNFWISSKLPALRKVMERIDVLLINEKEGELLTGKTNAIAASLELMKMGPKAVVIKRGEYGFVLRTSDEFFILPAFPVADVVDPTGAGDTFAGAFFGTLAKSDAGLSVAALKEACVNGCLLASFTVQDFSIRRLTQLTSADVQERGGAFERITRR